MSSFGVYNFGNNEAKILNFIFKMFYILCTFQNCNKKLENVFCFRDNGVWICIKMFKLQREYLLSAVNELTNSLKITNQTNKDFFQFNISQIHGKLR